MLTSVLNLINLWKIFNGRYFLWKFTKLITLTSFRREWKLQDYIKLKTKHLPAPTTWWSASWNLTEIISLQSSNKNIKKSFFQVLDNLVWRKPLKKCSKVLEKMCCTKIIYNYKSGKNRQTRSVIMTGTYFNRGEEAKRVIDR